MPAPEILSITVSETPEDAAPTIAPTPAAICESVVCCAMSVLVSPESPRMCSIGCPRTPPASLISATARSSLQTQEVREMRGYRSLEVVSRSLMVQHRFRLNRSLSNQQRPSLQLRMQQQP